MCQIILFDSSTKIVQGVDMDKKHDDRVSESTQGQGQLMLPFKLSLLNVKLNRHAAEILKPFHLTLMEWRVLYMLTEMSEATMTQLRRFSGIDAGQLSRAIKELVGKGLVKSSTSAKDQRNRLLAMTAKGHDVAKPARLAMAERRKRLAQALGEEQTAELLQYTEVLHEFLDRELEPKDCDNEQS